MKVLWGR